MIIGTYNGKPYRLVKILIPAIPYNSSWITIAPEDDVDDELAISVWGWQFQNPYGTERPRGDFSRESDLEALTLNLL